MTPEYKIKIEGAGNVEKLVQVLLENNYVVSAKRTLLDNYEISLYGKERVDGKGMKSSEGTTSINAPYITGKTIASSSSTGGSIKTTDDAHEWLIKELDKANNKINKNNTFWY